MKKLNLQGFSALGVLLAIVVLGVVGGTGWYVYSRQQVETDNQQTNTSDFTQTISSQSQAEDDVPEGWKKYSNQDLGVAFIYPSDWKLSDSAANAAEHGFDITISSPDSKRDDSGGISILKTGTYFYISVSPSENDLETSEEFVEYYKNPDNGGYVENVKLITVGQRKAAAYDCGHNNPFYCVTFVEKGRNISVEYEYPAVSGDFRANKQVAMASFNKLLESLELL